MPVQRKLPLLVTLLSLAACDGTAVPADAAATTDALSVTDVVTDVATSSPASEAGLEPGMLIQQVNRHKVRTVAEFNEAVAQEKDAKSLLLLVSDGQNARFLVLKQSE